MKEYKKNKSLYIMPIIFIMISIIAIISMSIYLHKNKISIIIIGISVPLVILVFSLVILVLLIREPKIKIKVYEESLIIDDIKIEFKDIDTVLPKRSMLGKYEANVLIVLKDNTYLIVKHVYDSYECIKDINKLLKKNTKAKRG